MIVTVALALSQCLQDLAEEVIEDGSYVYILEKELERGKNWLRKKL